MTSQKLIYNNIYIGSAKEVLPTLGVYDLIMFFDVIEHMSKQEGLSVLKLIQEKSKQALISTPLVMAKQEKSYGNVYETHVQQWTRKDLEAFGSVTELRYGKRKKRGVLLLEMNNG